MAAVLEFIAVILSIIISVAGLSALALAATVIEKQNEEEEINLSGVEIVNLTPHEVNLYLGNGEVISYPPANKEAPARAAMNTKIIGYLNINNQSIPITRNTYGELENVPPPSPNKLFIVSALAAQAAPWRKDLIIPSDPVRNEKNQIVGCKSFSII